VASVLDEIVAVKREHVAACRARVPLSEVESHARAAGPVRPFADALAARAADGYGIICEIKKASPSKGLIRADFDPPALARAYREGGAACLSVLTDTPYFQGEDAHLSAARAAVDIPVLRKDFMVDPYQVAEARALGADCILIIMAALTDAAAAELMAAARHYGMDALVEVHDQEEMERAAALQPRLVGINNRNLKTLSVDLATTEKLAPLAPPGALLVCESGLSSRADLDRMARVGARCFLIGESFMRQPDVTAAVRRMLQPAAA
jgi:indole-3-glycerol phosphate synthase